MWGSEMEVGKMGGMTRMGEGMGNGTGGIGWSCVGFCES
jgi:hypothetical protein